jgi:hypothetical protein
MLPFALAESSLPAPNSDPLYQEIQQDCRNPRFGGQRDASGQERSSATMALHFWTSLWTLLLWYDNRSGLC